MRSRLPLLNARFVLAKLVYENFHMRRLGHHELRPVQSERCIRSGHATKSGRERQITPDITLTLADLAVLSTGPGTFFTFCARHSFSRIIRRATAGNRLQWTGSPAWRTDGCRYS